MTWQKNWKLWKKTYKSLLFLKMPKNVLAQKSYILSSAKILFTFLCRQYLYPYKKYFFLKYLNLKVIKFHMIYSKTFRLKKLKNSQGKNHFLLRPLQTLLLTPNLHPNQPFATTKLYILHPKIPISKMFL